MNNPEVGDVIVFSRAGHLFGALVRDRFTSDYGVELYVELPPAATDVMESAPMEVTFVMAQDVAAVVGAVNVHNPDWSSVRSMIDLYKTGEHIEQ